MTPEIHFALAICFTAGFAVALGSALHALFLLITEVRK